MLVGSDNESWVSNSDSQWFIILNGDDHCLQRKSGSVKIAIEHGHRNILSDFPWGSVIFHENGDFPWPWVIEEEATILTTG